MLENLMMFLLWMLPLIPALTGAWVGWSRAPAPVLARHAAQSLALAGAVLVVILVMLPTASSLPLDSWLSLRPVSLLMVTLVLFIGWIVLRFSARYMAGEPRQGFYYRWLLLTLAAVLLTVLANHLVLLLLGWMAISLALHRLLLFYPQRAKTQLAAHKKFISARVGELSLALGFYLLFQHFNTASIDQILLLLPATSGGIWLHLAACCLVITALLKCAQLPVHGWLIQVVDAPTPVSALLHAGVINLGGYLLILFAPLLLQSQVASSLLLVAAGLSLVLSALIMQTRISIKVRLAWSTSAQMGFMLLECAMGLYELALLHLVAHSIYKAHAFLTAGHAVTQDAFVRQVKEQQHHPMLFVLHLTLMVSLVSIAATYLDGASSLWILLAISFAFYLTRHSADWHGYLRAVLTTAGLLLVLFSWKWLAADLFVLPVSPQPALATELCVLLLIATLIAGSWLLQQHQQSPRAVRWRHALFAGLYLDEWLTRLTQRLWPIDLKGAPRVTSDDHRPFN